MLDLQREQNNQTFLFVYFENEQLRYQYQYGISSVGNFKQILIFLGLVGLLLVSSPPRGWTGILGTAEGEAAM